MKNPWIDIPLEIYESHMSLSDVAQLQALQFWALLVVMD